MQKSITIAVCGAGTMGTGIAQTLICNGFKTIVYEVNQNVLTKSKTSLFATIENLFLNSKGIIDDFS